MSGYVLTKKYFATGNVVELQKGAAKRYIRLVLPAFVSVMFAWALFQSGAIITHDSWKFGAAGWVPALYVGHFPFLGTLFNGVIGAPLFGNVVLNGPLWTIQIELIGSILLFGMLAAFGRQPLWLCAWFLFFADIFSSSTPHILYYASFLGGALLNLARGWLQARPKISALFVAVALVCVAFDHVSVFAPMWRIHLPDFQPHGPDFNAAPQLWWNTIGAILIVAGILGSRPVASVFATRIPVFLGKISFSFYVLHFPLLMSVGLLTARFAQHCGVRFVVSVAISLVVFLATTVALATLFERFVDRPAIKLANKISEFSFFKGPQQTQVEPVEARKISISTQPKTIP